MEEHIKRIDDRMIETNKKLDMVQLNDEIKDELYYGTLDCINGMFSTCIEMNILKHNYINPIKSLLLNKRDIYIVNQIHGAIYYDDKSTKETPYKQFKIPDGMFLFHLKKVPFGVCNFENIIQVSSIISDLFYYISEAYYRDKTFIKKNAERIQYVLLNMQEELYKINQKPLTRPVYNEATNTRIEIEQVESYHIYKKYAHIKPEINIYKNGNTIINKDFSVTVTFENEKLIFSRSIEIIYMPDIKTRISYNLLNYIKPRYINYKNNKKWVLFYLLEDIINFLRSKKIHNCIFIDLSCSSSELSNNVNSLIKTAHEVEGEKYNFFNKIKKVRSKRNKNRQYAPNKSRSKTFFGW